MAGVFVTGTVTGTVPLEVLSSIRRHWQKQRQSHWLNSLNVKSEPLAEPAAVLLAVSV